MSIIKHAASFAHFFGRPPTVSQRRASAAKPSAAGSGLPRRGTTAATAGADVQGRAIESSALALQIVQAAARARGTTVATASADVQGRAIESSTLALQIVQAAARARGETPPVRIPEGADTAARAGTPAVCMTAEGIIAAGLRRTNPAVNAAGSIADLKARAKSNASAALALRILECGAAARGESL